MAWTNELIFEFLNLYQNEPSLWNTKTAGHKNKHDCYEAWIRIRDNLKDGSIPIKDIKRKRDNLMSTYRKLRRKMKESMRTSTSEDDVYKTDWPFYNIMASFLDGVYSPRIRKDSDESDKDGTDDDESENENLAELQKQNEDKQLRKKNPKRQRIDPEVDEPYIHLEPVPQTQTDHDECDLYCELLCKKLRGLEEKKREIAMLEIDRLIFNIKQSDIQVQSWFTQKQAPFARVYQSQPINYQQYEQQPSSVTQTERSLASSSMKLSPNYQETSSP